MDNLRSALRGRIGNIAQKTDDRQNLFEPQQIDELLRGWLLHAHKGRDRHDLAARRLDGYRYRLGIPALILSAIVGASVIASLEAKLGAWITIGVGLLGIVSSTLTGLQTFLGYAERAEHHRSSGVKYKAIIREIEDAFAKGLGPEPSSDKDVTAWIAGLKSRLDTLEQEAPVVPDWIYDRIEKRYQKVRFVHKTDELSRTWTGGEAEQQISADL
jgi:hypothetical protein